jgi:hypothetical protein
LEQGWTYEQVADRLRLEPADSGVDAATEEPAAHAAAPAEADRVTATAIVAANAMFQENADLATDELPPAARFLRDTMQTVASTQQVILNSQQASRDMLGVMIQDNLNLKGENTNLRERMLELERELAEIQRHFVDTRERTEIRMRVLEDAIAKLMAGQQASASRPPTSRPNPTPQTPPGYPPSGYPAQGTAQPSYPPASTAQPAYPPSGQAPQPYPPVGYAPQPATPSAYPPPYPDQQPPPPKRGFWARLLGG